jgi:hypothetical protein
LQVEIYCDGIGEITVTGPIIRIDLVSLSSTERDENNNPKPQFRQRIIMPLDAFANSVRLMQRVMQGLTDAGGAGGSASVSNGDARGEGPPAGRLRSVSGNSSPNFPS